MKNIKCQYSFVEFYSRLFSKCLNLKFIYNSLFVSAVTFFFAFNNDIIPEPQTNFANIVLGVYVGLQVAWEIWFEINKKFVLRNASGIFLNNGFNSFSYFQLSLKCDKDYIVRVDGHSAIYTFH